MTPQGHFMVVAPVAAGREPALRALLASMTSTPGGADPHNTVLPFGAFDGLHFARFALLTDETGVDLKAYGLEPSRLPTNLAFIGDCDGSPDEFLAELSRRAGDGLRQLFAHCDGFTPERDVGAWLSEHNQPAAAIYVNWVGRTVRQVREERALQQALTNRLAGGPRASHHSARSLRTELLEFVRAEIAAGRLVLTPPAPTPLGWWLKSCLNVVLVPLIGLALLPFLIVLSPFLILKLRRLETTDPEIFPRPSVEATDALQRIEDLDVTNQFSALGHAKPGLFRRALVTVLLLLLDYACRHIYTRGHLTRVQTIHFASWAFIDGKSRIVFASNYDGSLESYMDDFINKVGWGLNLVFSNGIGYPRTDWLILGGARHEQPFKYFLRRHEVPTQVWYKAYPGLNAVDLARNQKIREGFEQAQMTDAEAIAWLQLL